MNIPIKVHLAIRIIIFIFATTICLSGCYEKNSGEKIAKVYCGSCHLMPDPKLLDKKTWEKSVLPQMAYMLGVRPLNALRKELGDAEISEVQMSGVIPAEPVLPESEWKKIVQYYVENAPDSLMPIDPKIRYEALTQFQVKNIATTSIGNLSLLQFNKTNSKLYLGDRQNGFYILNNKFKQEAFSTLGSPPSDMILQPDGSLILSLLGRMEPTNLPLGSLVKISDEKRTSNKEFIPQTLLTGLYRPVCIRQTDFLQNGKQQIIVGNFGHYVGHLSWYDLQEKNQKGTLLRAFPGALDIIVRDFNHDKLPDVMALMAQGSEGVFIFYNQGKNSSGKPEFKEEQVLKFPPVYGSSSIELRDFDGDGNEDIIYANGDNGDYSRVLKPYHGVRIFLNDGKNNFKERYFFQMNGATKALARDFDGDGDLDIAAIAYFADFTKKPQKSFVYLENQGNYRFIPHISALTDTGRWLLMDTADVDNDGDEDILLGSCTNVPMRVPKDVKYKWDNAKTTVLLLENKQKH